MKTKNRKSTVIALKNEKSPAGDRPALRPQGWGLFRENIALKA